MNFLSIFVVAFCSYLLASVLAEVLDKRSSVRIIQGKASWYGSAYRGSTMANGHPFDPDALSAASWDFPLGTFVRVTVAGSRRSIVVSVTDRGPAPHLVRDGRVIDLSRAAFSEIAPLSSGLVVVTVQRWEEPK